MADHEGRTVTFPDVGGPDGGNGNGDPGGWGARIVAKLDLALGRLGDAQDETNRQLRRLRAEARAMPALVKLSSVFTYSTAAAAGITQQGGTGIGVLVGGPEIGREWRVRQAIITGTLLTSAPGGTVWFLVAGGLPNDVTAFPTSVIDFSLTVPNKAVYSNEQFYVQPNENIYMVVTGGTNGAQYVASISYYESAFRPRETLEAI